MLKSLFANIFLTTVKIVFGLISKSKTLIADGVHSFSDMATDIIGLVGAKIANKRPDRNHPYGHGKAEYLTSLFISILIIYLAYKIFINSFSKSEVINDYYILIISLVTIVIKFLVSGYLIKKGKQYNSNILITSGSESRYDCISSALAFVFILLSILSNRFSFLKYADTIGSIIISLLTLKVGVQFFIENFNSALGEVDLDQTKIHEIKTIINNYKEVENIRRVTILKYGGYSSIIIDLEMKKNIRLKKLSLIEKSMKNELKDSNPDYKYVTINVRAYEKNDKEEEVN